MKMMKVIYVSDDQLHMIRKSLLIATFFLIHIFLLFLDVFWWGFVLFEFITPITNKRNDEIRKS
ncbi:hypothetical protein OIU77_003080 [Salix suchowensis]|uniref:Uncharacterized protein n=1 Tax=Salix suchowensis TaxID=1278906 RepID=A0ABQ9AZL5_9ROSI|nr:hypothetical protein OIU77_003080 [Salix suchowensis]